MNFEKESVDVKFSYSISPPPNDQSLAYLIDDNTTLKIAAGALN